MKSKRGLTIIITILLLISVLSGGLLFTYTYSLRRAENEFDDLAKVFYNNPVKEIKEQVKEEKKVDVLVEEERDLQQLFNKNNDLAAWISVKGTKIDYPVMHTPDDPEYYLYRNFNKEYSISGVPFMDGKSSLDPPSDNILIHGHHMKDGSMFAQLLGYRDKEFLQKHPTIELHTLNGKWTYDIISVFPVDVAGDKIHEFDYHNFINAKDQEEFDNYVSGAKAYSLFDTGINAKYGDQLLTLSTCSYHTKHGRFVVIGKARNTYDSN